MIELPVMTFDRKEDWQSWLKAQHDSSSGVWLKIAKKRSGVATVTHEEALEVALMYGWIDGRRTAFDERYFTQSFGPRRRGSKWSKINRETAERLIAEGRMASAGQRAVDAAKANGNWDAAYAGQRSMTVPDDLQRELDRNEAAARKFESLDSRNRYSILYRIQDAKRPETRARRVAKFVDMLAAGDTIYP